MAISNDLNISQPGYVCFDGQATFTGRTFQAGAGITLTNPDGIAGNTTIALSGGSGAVEHLTGDSGGTLNPDGSNNFNIIANNAGNHSGATVSISGSGSTLTLNLTDSFTSQNTFIGYQVANLTYTGVATNNTSVGTFNLGGLTSGIGNTVIGSGNASLINSGGSNVVIGYAALTGSTTSSYNVIIGLNAGNSLRTSDSSNIHIMNLGMAGDNHVMRLGTQGGVSLGTISQTYIAGVQNQLSGLVVPVTTPGAYPYTTLITDQVILVDSSSARTINLVSSPVTGTTFRIKDNVGNAAAQNITITPNAGNIDGSASYKITANYGSADVVYNGTQWNVL